MKKTVFITLVSLLLCLSIFSGCTFINQTVAGIQGLVDTTTSSINRSAEAALLSATGLADLQASMVALVVYSNAFFAGGFMYGYDNFQEGEGVVWEISSISEGEKQSITVERALLKRLPGGSSWWRLSYSDDESTLISEALIDQGYELLAFRYRDTETKDIIEWIPEKEEEEKGQQGETADSYNEEEMPRFFDGSWEPYIQGKENVSVPAGSWSCDRVVVEESYEYTTYDDEGNEVDAEGSYRYEWWINESVPGKLVKYRWEERDDASQEATIMTGELIKHAEGYGTELNSF